MVSRADIDMDYAKAAAYATERQRQREFDAAEMRENVGYDHLQAAWTATLRQRMLEETAALEGQSIYEYMRATDTSPCTEFAKRGNSSSSPQPSHCVLTGATCC